MQLDHTYELSFKGSEEGKAGSIGRHIKLTAIKNFNITKHSIPFRLKKHRESIKINNIEDW